MIEVLLLCTIVGISDGDTLTARCNQQLGQKVQNLAAETHRVRLADIDAPEKKQPFGQRSKQHLSALCFQKPAELRPQARQDRYGRMIAHVRCDGIDANAAQVSTGMAWVYTRYVPKGSPLQALQERAEQEHRGLWGSRAPIPPWEWRRQNRGTADSLEH